MTTPTAPGGREVIRALFIDMGQQLRSGRWVKPPRARYECRLCTYSESVEGAEQVAAFVSHIRDTHRAACPAALNTERNTAA